MLATATFDYVTEADHGHAVAGRGPTFFIIDRTGQETAVEATDVIEMWHFSEDLARFRKL